MFQQVSKLLEKLGPESHSSSWATRLLFIHNASPTFKMGLVSGLHGVHPPDKMLGSVIVVLLATDGK